MMMKVYPKVFLLAWVLMCSACAASQPSSGRAGQMIDRVMQRYDLDQDGVITSFEIAEARAAQFQRLDQNADGQLSEAELALMQEEVVARSGGRFARQRRFSGSDRPGLAQLDTNEDGLVSLAEFEASEPPLLNRADHNGDGEITRSELDGLVADARSRFRR